MEGVLIASGPAVKAGAGLDPSANLLDIAPTILHLLGVPIPADMDGRYLAELFDPAVVPSPEPAEGQNGEHSTGEYVAPAYTEEEDAAIQQLRLRPTRRLPPDRPSVKAPGPDSPNRTSGSSWTALRRAVSHWAWTARRSGSLAANRR